MESNRSTVREAIASGRASARMVAGNTYARVYREMQRRNPGGWEFGADRTTLAISLPGWLRALDRASYIDARSKAEALPA
jgi:hypothetical protein